MPRPLAVLLLLLAALAGCADVQVRGATVTDEDLRADGQWTDRDALARALLDHEAPADQQGRWPTRLVPAHRKALTEVRVGERTLYLPRVRWVPGTPFLELGLLEALLGLDYERRYQFIGKDGVDAYVLLNRDRAPTVIAADPDRPLREPETPARAFDAVERSLERDVLRVLESLQPIQP